MNQTSEYGKKPSFRPDFGPFTPNLVLKFFLLILPLLDVRNCCKLSLYAISRKTNEPNLGNSKKLSFGPHFGPFGPNSGHQIFFHKSGFANFFFKNLAPPVTRYYSQLSHVQYQKKLMIQS